MLASSSEPAPNLVQWLCLLPLTSILISLVAAASVLVWLHRLRGAGEKLMARQLWHLQLANVIDCGLAIIWYVIDLLPLEISLGSEPSKFLDALCTISMFNNFAFMTALLIEVHIALVTVAALYRCHATIRRCSRRIAFTWIPGLILGAVVVYPSGTFWQGADHIGNGGGHCATKTGSGEEIKAAIVTSALCMCILTYAVGFVRATTHGALSLQARIWKRAKLFIAAAVVSWFPYVIFVYENEGRQLSGSTVAAYWFYITRALFFSNGLLNAVVYVVQSRFLAREERRKKENREPRLRARSSVPAFNVAFASQVSLEEFTPTQAAALSLAERGTVAIEARNFQEDDRVQSLNSTAWMAECLADDLFGCFDEDFPPAGSDGLEGFSTGSSGRSGDSTAVSFSQMLR